MKIRLTFLLLFLWYCGFSQQAKIENYRDSLYAKAQMSGENSLFKNYTDSLYRQLNYTSNDSIRVWTMLELSNNYKYRKTDSSVYFAKMAVIQARKLNMKLAELSALSYYCIAENCIGNYSKSLQIALRLIKLAENYHIPYSQMAGKSMLGFNYLDTKEYRKAINKFRESLDYFNSINDETFSSLTSAYLAETYSDYGRKDSASYYSKLTQSYPGRAIWVIPFAAYHIGKVYLNNGEKKEALRYFQEARTKSSNVEKYYEFLATDQIAKLYNTANQPDSALYYGRLALSIAEETGFYANLIEANLFLSGFYKSSDTGKALEYSENASLYKDSLLQMERGMAIQDYVNTDVAQRQSELEEARKEFRSRLKMNALLGSSFTLLVVALVLFWSRRQKQKAKKQIEDSYNQLKATQTQLIQSEKMASLGELTAGIAHEIQNPLNFVNNFSEVNKELISELKDVLAKGNGPLAIELANNINDNEEKINQHGKRADEIVKGMLQHSRGSSNVKEPTDINTLADEYLRLAYHGLRAKDKSFNATMNTEFDANLEPVNVVPQDIGRVILNLITNAFYAVNDKKKQLTPGGSGTLGGLSDYEPTVTVRTRKVAGKIEITVSDNGNGIPDELKSKIFQPFFTTKPSGQGTGLGLSISYDIINAHNGDLKIETKKGEYTSFTIQLPI